jgi:hypothetical protein
MNYFIAEIGYDMQVQRGASSESASQLFKNYAGLRLCRG